MKASGSVMSGLREWSAVGMQAVLEPAAGAALVAAGVLAVGVQRFPFPVDNVYLAAIAQRSPWVYAGFHKGYYALVWFTTPWLVLTGLGELVRRLLPTAKSEERPGPAASPAERLHELRASVETIEMPRYIPPQERKSLYVILGEEHLPQDMGPVAQPRWIVQLPKGLFCGTKVFGAVGTGKTRMVMLSMLYQLLGFAATDPLRRLGALVMEAKGNFCAQVRGILERLNRSEDMIELSTESEWALNCLRDGDAQAQAFFIATWISNVFGRAKDPFWPSQATNVIKWLIHLHRCLYDYVTLADIYKAVLSEARIGEMVAEGDKRFAPQVVVLVAPPAYADHAKALADCGFAFDSSTNCMRALQTTRVREAVEKCGVAHRCEPAPGANQSEEEAEKSMRFAAVRDWYTDDWMGMTPQLRRSVAAGILSNLSVFVSEPAINRVFCPPKEAYDPKLNVADANGKYKYGRVVPSFSWLIDQGKVLCVNFPSSKDDSLAKLLGTLVKLEFSRAVLERPKQMAAHPERYYREVLFVCDEYQWFATSSGGSALDDKGTFSMSRESKLIPIVATQAKSMLSSSGIEKESLTALLQTLGTDIILRQRCTETLEYAEAMAGSDYRMVASYGVSESSQDAGVSAVSGEAAVDGARSLVQSRTYQRKEEARFTQTQFAELPAGVAVVCQNDGMNQHPGRLNYLLAYDLSPETSWWDHYQAGRIVDDELPEELR